MFGKLVGGVLGFLMGGPFGALLGLFAGHFFDRGLDGIDSLPGGGPSDAQRADVQKVFFESCFLFLGHLAKADGRVSEEEIAFTENIIVRMGLTAEHRQQAIDLFKRGAEPSFDFDAAVEKFSVSCRKYTLLKQTLLNFVINAAMADGELHPAERTILQQIAEGMGIPAGMFQRLLDMATGQQHFQGQQHASASVDDAYRALGVSADSTDRDIKRAYRKLMSENHPDKLIAQGVPDDMVKMATERSQEIQNAYELIKKQRSKV